MLAVPIALGHLGEALRVAPEVADPSAYVTVAQEHLGRVATLAAHDAGPNAAQKAKPLALWMSRQRRSAASQVAEAPAVLCSTTHHLAELPRSAAEHAEGDAPAGVATAADLAEPLACRHVVQRRPATPHVASAATARTVAEEKLVFTIRPAAGHAPHLVVKQVGRVLGLGPEVEPGDGELPLQRVVARHDQGHNVTNGYAIRVHEVLPAAAQELCAPGCPSRASHPHGHAEVVQRAPGHEDDPGGRREVLGLRLGDADKEQARPVYPLRKLRPAW
mmetsp:Transcript_74088/g.196841  ORF Transcript_74088/g.196841 Transcript_74088/m.196841 type:complete len:276 (+) Transcript_74088:303-1130(+)